MAATRSRRPFGGVEARRSSRTKKVVSYRATYTGPDAERYHQTFGDRIAAELWLGQERKLIDAGQWSPPETRNVVIERMTLNEWAVDYIESRALAPATYRNYARALKAHIEPTIGRKFLDEITVTDVAAWHTRLSTQLRARAKQAGRTNGDGSGEVSSTYRFLSGLFKAAVTSGILDSSPARVVGGGRYKRKRQPVVLASAEVQALALALPERFRALADLLSWTGLRIGEARALRRRDLDLRDLDAASISVMQNVSHGGKGVGAVIGKVKTEAGNRTVAIPKELAQVLAEHVDRFSQPGRDGLVFTSRSGGLLSDSVWRYAWIKARNFAGLPDVKTHDLRHTSLTRAARAGATTAELMHRAGHTEARIAMIYQHASAERDRMIAERMAVMVHDDELAARRVLKEAGREATPEASSDSSGHL